MKHWRIEGLSCLAALLLAGCGLDPVKPDQEIVLQPGEGIAAVVFDTLDVLNAVTIRSPDRNGMEFGVSYVDKGVHLYVFIVPAGSYCLVKFQTSFYTITQDDPTHGVCFDVVAGKVAYSGNLSPRAHGQSLQTDQNYDWPAFEKMFKEQYPKLAQYPIVTP
jgi:hypothetical protein